MKPSRIVLAAKRLADLCVGSAGALFFFATYPLMAVLIKSESPGPVLYSQARVGINRRAGRSPGTRWARAGDSASAGPGLPSRRRNDYGGRVFTILKYRSMRLDAEERGPQLARKGHDPRVTKVGRWLRALHLDELPQFLNVLRGDMSLIGPRPERPYFTTRYARQIPHYLDRTSGIRPGLTGLAQIIAGYDDSLASVVRKAHFDYAYRASTCDFRSWIRLEAWVAIRTVHYLARKPRTAAVADGEAHGPGRPGGTRFLALTPGKREPGLRGPVHRHETASSTILAGSSPFELGRVLEEGAAMLPRKDLDVQVNPNGNFDLEDLGHLVRLVYEVKRRGGRVTVKDSSPRVQKMLKEIRMDRVVEVHRPMDSVRNFMTVDVECWFHAYNLKQRVPPSTWHLQPTRVVENVRRILDLFRTYDTRATFFMLGWVADRFPDVVRMIDDAGHELATHGYHHQLLTDMTPPQFEEDLEKSLVAIGKRSKQTVIGHRASNFTIVESTLWALEILAKHGIEYDSSIFPVGRQRYGISGYPNRSPHRLRFAHGLELAEIPMSTLGTGQRRIPIAGGGYLRLYPYRVTDRFIERTNRQGLPAMVYFHPWELDSAQKRLSVGALKGFQHYVNLGTTEWKLSRLMERFFFTSIKENLGTRRMQSLLRKDPVRIETGTGLASLEPEGPGRPFRAAGLETPAAQVQSDSR